MVGTDTVGWWVCSCAEMFCVPKQAVYSWSNWFLFPQMHTNMHNGWNDSLLVIFLLFHDSTHAWHCQFLRTCAVSCNDALCSSLIVSFHLLSLQSFLCSCCSDIIESWEKWCLAMIKQSTDSHVYNLYTKHFYAAAQWQCECQTNRDGIMQWSIDSEFTWKTHGRNGIWIC